MNSLVTMRPKRFALFVFLSLFADLAGLATETTAMAEAAERKPLSETLVGGAKRDYDAARLLFGAGNFREALQKLQSAYSASREPELLWNEAACEKNLGHFARAEGLLTRYLTEAGARLPENLRAETNALLQTLAERTAPLTVLIDVPGANVYVDGEIEGISPLAAPLLVDLGTRELRVVKGGYREYVQSVAVSAAPPPVHVALVEDRTSGHLVVTGGVGDSVEIDNRWVSKGGWEGDLDAGEHTVRISAAGMTPLERKVTLEVGKTLNVPLTLEPLTLENRASHAGVPTWVWIAGASVVAVGAGVGGYFLATKPKDQTVPLAAGTFPGGGVQLASGGHF